MSSNQFQTGTQDEAYLEIWKVEHEYVRTRWTIATFFMSVSFAILGFSFQGKLALPEVVAIRISGLFIYWFAYILYWNFYAYSKFLRNYLLDMEAANRSSLDIQGKTEMTLRPAKGKQQLPTKHLLLYFGVIYTVGVILLWLLGL
ncbi:MAG TPA: hypothetical protein VFA10_26220 [Ktedonobacteraceae bacterium]|nr:hypothetical protein [Ktedonobacteraceae bacterium]